MFDKTAICWLKTNTLSLCLSQARLAIQRGAQAVIFDITDDPAAAAAAVCVCVLIFYLLYI